MFRIFFISAEKVYNLSFAVGKYSADVLNFSVYVFNLNDGVIQPEI